MLRGGGATTGQRGRLNAATLGGVVAGEGVHSDVGELLQHRTWRGGEEQRGNWAEKPGEAELTTRPRWQHG
jgi:hypothetical protein